MYNYLECFHDRGKKDDKLVIDAEVYCYVLYNVPYMYCILFFSTGSVRPSAATRSPPKTGGHLLAGERTVPN